MTESESENKPLLNVTSDEARFSGASDEKPGMEFKDD